MERRETMTPLWSITFDPSNREGTWLEKARFDALPIFSKDLPLSLDNQRLALEFFDRLNTSFNELAKNYLNESTLDDELTPHAKEMQAQFDTLNLWIQWIRILLKNPNQDPPIQDLPPSL